MDTELLKTFLEVNRTRHFGRAAENLFISQSAVSARIHQLEEQLGIRLFERERNNIQLTAAGHKLLKFSETILGVWNRARLEVAVSDEDRIAVAVGGMPSLWDDYLQQWLRSVRREIPELVLTVETHSTTEIVRRVSDRTLDIGFSFETPQLSAEVKDLTAALKDCGNILDDVEAEIRETAGLPVDGGIEAVADGETA